MGKHHQLFADSDKKHDPSNMNRVAVHLTPVTPNPCPERFDVVSVQFGPKTKAIAIVFNNKEKSANIMDKAFLEGLAALVAQLKVLLAQEKETCTIPSASHQTKSEAGESDADHDVAGDDGDATPSSLATSMIIFCSAKPTSFCHGASVEMQAELTTWESCYEGSTSIKQLFQAIEDLPVPTVSVFNATTLGGGLELGLACDYRFAASSRVQIGLPEVKLGIIPGGGGCVRLPRLIGFTQALNLILQGSVLSPSRAKKAGIVDRLISEDLTFPASLLATGEPTANAPRLGWIRSLFKEMRHRKKPVPKFPLCIAACTWTEQQIIYSFARTTLDKRVHRKYPAPYRLLATLFECWNTSSLATAYDLESKAYADMAMTRESRALQSIFIHKSAIKRSSGQYFHQQLSSTRKKHLSRAATIEGAISTLSTPSQKEGAKTRSTGSEGRSNSSSNSSSSSKSHTPASSASSSFSGDLPAMPRTRVLVVGAGYMGAGIGHHMLDCGLEVLFYDVSEAALARARDRVKALFGKKYQGKVRGIVAALTFSTDLDECLDKLTENGPSVRPVVLEAATEELSLKRQLIEKILAHPDKRIIVATNTSSIPIRVIAEGFDGCERVVGLHFFHPEKNITPMVEVVPSKYTSAAVGLSMIELAGAMKKIPAVVGDNIAFVVNRIAFFWYGIAGMLLVRGAASVSAVDASMRDVGCMAGPFAVLDSIQLTTAIKVAKSILALHADGHASDGTTHTSSTTKQHGVQSGQDLLYLLEEMVAKGMVGRQSTGSSRGFYAYEKGRKSGTNAAEVKSLVHVVRARSKTLSQQQRTAGTDSGKSLKRMPHLAKDEVAQVLLFALVNEACVILSENMHVNARDIDLLMVLAMGIAPNYGGLLAYADIIGADVIVEKLVEFNEKLGLDLAISPYLAKVAEDTRRSRTTAHAKKQGSVEKRESEPFLFRPDISVHEGPNGVVGDVSRWCPGPLGLVDAVVATAVGAGAFLLSRL